MSSRARLLGGQPSIHFPTRAGERDVEARGGLTSVRDRCRGVGSGETTVARSRRRREARRRLPSRRLLVQWWCEPSCDPGKATVPDRAVPRRRLRGEPVRSLSRGASSTSSFAGGRGVRHSPASRAGCAPAGRGSTTTTSGSWPARRRSAVPASARFPAARGPKPGRRSRPTARIVRRSTKRSSECLRGRSAIMRAGRRARDEARGRPCRCRSGGRRGRACARRAAPACRVPPSSPRAPPAVTRQRPTALQRRGPSLQLQRRSEASR